MPTKRKEGINVEKMVASAYRANSSTNRMFGYSTSYLFASYLPTCNTMIWQSGMFTVQQLTKASKRGSYQTNAVVVVRQHDLVGDHQRSHLPFPLPPL